MYVKYRSLLVLLMFRVVRSFIRNVKSPSLCGGTERKGRVLESRFAVLINRAYGTSSGDNPGKAGRIRRYTWPPDFRKAGGIYLTLRRERKKGERGRGYSCADQMFFPGDLNASRIITRTCFDNARGGRDHGATEGRREKWRILTVLSGRTGSSYSQPAKETRG